MSILEVIAKSFIESFMPKRLLPFLLLYLLYSFCFLILFMPILSVLPFLATYKYSPQQISLVEINGTALTIVSIIVLLLNLWFTGALTHDVFSGKGFDEGLKYTRKFYWQLLALFVVLALVVAISLFLPFEISLIVVFLIGWFFIFSIPSIIIKKDSFEIGITRSLNTVRKNMKKTFLFGILTYFIASLIFYFSIFFVVLTTFPLAERFLLVMVLSFSGVQDPALEGELIQAVGFIMNSYPSLIAVSVVFSLFASFSYVFLFSAKTNYFLELSKKKLIYL